MSAVMDDLTEAIVSSIQAIVAGSGPEGLPACEVWIGLQRQNILVSRETTTRWLRTMHDAHQVEVRHGLWVTGPPQLLVWDKPPQAGPYEQWASCQADSAPPGTYQPNMSPAWMARWKATMRGQRSEDLMEDLRVEIRKSVASGHHSAQAKIVVCLSGEVLMSMNGTAEFTAQEFAELPLAVAEAREAMQRYARDHPAPAAKVTA